MQFFLMYSKKSYSRGLFTKSDVRLKNKMSKTGAQEECVTTTEEKMHFYHI